MDNIYDQIYKTELINLQDLITDSQNILLSLYNIKEEVWRYHPANDDFVNPIKEYDEISSQISELEKKISKLELNIIHLNSTN